MSAIRELLTGGRVVAYYPQLARKLGSIAAALLLQQIAHLQGDEDYCPDGEWVEVSQDEIEGMLAMSPKVQRASRDRLFEANVMAEKRPATKRANIRYKVEWEAVEALLRSPNGKSKRKVKRVPKESPNGNPPIIRGNKNNEYSLRSHSADSESDASSQPENNQAQSEQASLRRGTPKESMTTKQFGVAELIERVQAAREEGLKIHSPTDAERRQFGAIFEQCLQDDYDPEELMWAFDYMVAKASGQVDGEPKAWCGYRTALDNVSEGWRPRRSYRGGASGLSEEEKQEQQEYINETQRILAKAMKEAGIDG